MPLNDATPRHDVAFLDAFLPHQQLAIAMAEVELAHGRWEPVMQLAQQIKASRKADVEALRKVRARSSNQAPQQNRPPEQARDELLHLEAARGAEVDHLFLSEMIAHDEVGLAVARARLPRIQDPEVRKIAEDYVAREEREVESLRAMLDAARRETERSSTSRDRE
jgi:uncharacterized protein (DUF305 family)